jgi:hypothetical protein
MSEPSNVTPIFTRRATFFFTPPGSPRRYTLAPLSFRERQARSGEMLRDLGLFPGAQVMMEALRDAVREASPANAPELLAAIDAAEETPGDAPAQLRLLAIENAFAGPTPYGALLEARQRHTSNLPLYAARYALRGWDGPDLPPFRREHGLVPMELLDEIDPDELEAVGWRAAGVSQLAGDDAKNSEAPSSSPETPSGSTQGSAATTEAAGS